MQFTNSDSSIKNTVKIVFAILAVSRSGSAFANAAHTLRDPQAQNI